jgi:hypothetical protein
MYYLFIYYVKEGGINGRFICSLWVFWLIKCGMIKSTILLYSFFNNLIIETEIGKHIYSIFIRYNGRWNEHLPEKETKVSIPESDIIVFQNDLTPISVLIVDLTFLLRANLCRSIIQ